MRRRKLLLGAAAALGLARTPALAQQPGRVYRVGVALPMGGLTAQPYVEAIRRTLSAHGFTEGGNLQLEVRYGSMSADARELAVQEFDALLACTTGLAQAMHAAAVPAPLVFAWVADPVHAGLVRSYAHPGGNVTGVANRYFELTRKRVELLREILPAVRRIAVAAGVFDVTGRAAFREAEGVAGRLGIQLIEAELIPRGVSALERVLAEGAEALMFITPFTLFGMNYAAAEIVRFGIERRVPAIFADRETVEAGGLLSYSNDAFDDLRLAADLVARLLKGERPGDIPVEQAARFELAVNLKTARAIGMEVPQTVLLRADRVIE